VICEPPEVHARGLLILLARRDVMGSIADSLSDRVPPPDGRHVPSMRRPRIITMSGSVTVVSPHGRWNMCIPERHRSTSIINVAESINDRPRVVTSRASGRNPARCMNDSYRSSHVKGQCVRILRCCKHCGTK
jgi:hypothetical protein